MASQPIQCEMCLEENAVGRCDTCGPVGEACLRIHQKGKIFRTHIINVLNKDSLATIRIDITEERCKQHRTERTNFLCKTHESMICGRCLRSEHPSCLQEVVDLLHVDFKINCEKVNSMKALFNELKDEILLLKVDAEHSKDYYKKNADKCVQECMDLGNRIKQRVDELTSNIRDGIAMRQSKNVSAHSLITVACDEKSKWCAEKEKKIDDFVDNNMAGYLYLMGRHIEEDISNAISDLKEIKSKYIFKGIDFKQNKVILNCLFEDLEEVCELHEEVTGSDDGDSDDVATSTTEKNKTRRGLTALLNQAKHNLDQSEKKMKRFTMTKRKGKPKPKGSNPDTEAMSNQGEHLKPMTMRSQAPPPKSPAQVTQTQPAMSELVQMPPNSVPPHISASNINSSNDDFGDDQVDGAVATHLKCLLPQGTQPTGTVAVEFNENKLGRGIKTTVDRKNGDFLLHYTGELITGEEGDRREAKNSTGFRFFFISKGKQLCVDASEESGRLGRLVNHGHKKELNAVMKEVSGQLILFAQSPSFQDNTQGTSDTNTVHQTSSTDGDTLETNVEQSSPVTAVEDQLTCTASVESPSFQDNTTDASDTNTVHQTSSTDGDTLETNVEQSSSVTAVEDQLTCTARVESPSFQDNTPDASDTNTVHQTSSTDVTAVEDQLTCTARVESPSFQDNTPDASDTNTVHQTSSTDGDTLKTNLEQSSTVKAVEDQLTCTARVESPSFQDNTPDVSDTNTGHQTSSTHDNTPDASDTNTVHQTSSTDGDTLETNVEQSSPVTAVEDQLTCTARIESPSFQDNTPDASDTNTVHQTSRTEGDTLETNVEQSSPVTAVEDQVTFPDIVESPSFQDNTPDASDTNTVHHTSRKDFDTLETNVEQSSPVTAVEKQVTFPDIVESPSFQDNTQGTSDTNTVHQTSSTDGDTLETNVEQSSPVTAVEDKLTCTASVESPSFQDNTTDASDTNTVHQTSSTDGDTLETNVEQSSPVTAVEDQLTCTARVESPSFQDNTPDASDTNTVHQTSSTEGDTLETNVEQSSPVTAVEEQVTFPDIVESPSFQDNTQGTSDTNTVHQTSSTDGDTLETNVEQSSPVTAVEDQLTCTASVESPSFQDNTTDASDINTVHQTSSTDGDTLETNVEQSSSVTAVEDQLTCTARVESPSFQDNTPDASDTNTVHQTSSTDGDTLETNVELSFSVTAVKDQVTFPDIVETVEDQLTCTARVESPSFQDNTPDASDTNTVHQTSSTDGDTLKTNLEQSSTVKAVEDQLTCTARVESPSFQDNTPDASDTNTVHQTSSTHDNTPDASDTNTVHQTSSTDGDTLETNVEQSSPVTAVEDQLTCTARVESPSFQDNTPDASDTNTVHQTSRTEGDTLETNVEQASPVTAVEEQVTFPDIVESPSFQDNTPDASDTNTVHHTSRKDVDTLETNVEQSSPVTPLKSNPSFQDNTQGTSDTNTVHQTSSTDGDTLETNVEQSSPVTAVEDQLTCTASVESPSFQDNTTDASDTNTVHQTSSTDGDTLETNVEQSSSVTAVEDQLTCTARVESPSFQDNTPDASDTNTVHQTSSTDVTAVEDQLTCTARVESPSFQDNTPDASDTNTVHQTSSTDGDTLKTNLEQSSTVKAVEDQLTCTARVESPSFQDNTPDASDTNTVHQTSSTHDNTPDASDTNTVHQTSSTEGDTLETNVEQSSPVTAVEDQVTFPDIVESPSFQDNTPDASDTNTVHHTSRKDVDTLETNVEQSSPVTAVEKQVTFPDIVESPSFQDNTQGTSDTNTVHQTSSTDGDTLETNVEQSSSVTAVEDQLTCTARVESPSFRDNTPDASDTNTVHQTSSTDGDTLETNVELFFSVTAVKDQVTFPGIVESPSFQDNTTDAFDTNTIHQTSSTDGDTLETIVEQSSPVTDVEDQLTCTARVESPSFQDNTPDASDTNTVHQTSSTDGDTLETNVEQSSPVTAVDDQVTFPDIVESLFWEDNADPCTDDREKYEKLLEANREPAVTYTSKDVPAVPEQVQVTCKELPVEPHSSSEESAYMEAKIDGRMDIVHTQGKQDKKVATLLNRDMVDAINLLIATRAACGILDTNMYVFANQLDGHLSTWTSLRDQAVQAQCSKPELINCNSLRKYIATLMDLNDGEVQWVSSHLGHTVKTHKDFYRLQEAAIEIGKVSKLLIAAESGKLSKYKGKSLAALQLDGMKI
ncbi:KMT5A-like protein [Mya arenaria]|uniref:KMT5A-like protein n=1 Tax=Mya arenaria TaxID=6604 RepID=A0ABY7ENS9_MYAAR|nr:KMT5A-like protein [Mya arenaria]